MSRVDIDRGDTHILSEEAPPSETPVGSGGRVPSPRPYPRRGFGQLGPRSLTARIVTGVVLLVFVVVASVGIGTYFTLRSSLESRLDQQVASAAGQNAVYFGRGCRPSDTRVNVFVCQTPSGPESTGAEWVALLDPNDGSVLGNINGDSGPIVNLTLNGRQRASLARNPNQTMDVSDDGRSLRVTARANNVGLLVV
ncbi:MAG: hypothetical protein QOJ34_177, partial [Pseudonocardiales bacterium]|nr:hypothetical protein [Pseudonocardiales bacterium]